VNHFQHPYYRTTGYTLGVVLVGLILASLATTSWSTSEAERFALASRKAAAAEERAVARENELGVFNRQMVPVRAFTKEWAPYAKMKESVDVSGAMRTELENIAQKRLSLVTDQATTPKPVDYTYQGFTYTVQKVSLRASGGNIASLLTWLGEAEKAYPYARVEECTVTAHTGANMSISISLVQPLVPSRKLP